MTRIPVPLAVRANLNRHHPAGTSRLVNMVAEPQPADENSPIIVRRAEGFGTALVTSDSFATAGGLAPDELWPGADGTRYYNLRGMRAMSGKLYFVIEGKLWEVTTAGVITQRGTGITGGGRVWLEHNGIDLVILNDLGNAWTFRPSTNAFAAISDPDFQSASWVQFFDQYMVFGKKDSAQFFISGIADATAYDPLEVASSETLPDKLVSGLRSGRDILLFGEDSTEIWYNEGGLDFPFARAPDGLVEVGCAAPLSPARVDNSVIWLARELGGLSVRRLSGRTPVRISTPDLDDELDSYDPALVANAYSMSWTLGGHSYYALNIPGVFRTYVYDALTNAWHRRASRQSEWWRVGAIEPFNGRVYGMDQILLRIVAMERDSYFETSTEVMPWEMVTPPINSERRAMLINRLELEVDAGRITNTQIDYEGYGIPHVWMSWSDDNGRTWSNEYPRSMGRPGQYKTRLVWHNLGMTRTGRCFRFRGGDVAPVALLRAWADVEYGR